MLVISISKLILLKFLGKTVLKLLSYKRLPIIPPLKLQLKTLHYIDGSSDLWRSFQSKNVILYHASTFYIKMTKI